MLKIWTCQSFLVFSRELQSGIISTGYSKLQRYVFIISSACQMFVKTSPASSQGNGSPSDGDPDMKIVSFDSNVFKLIFTVQLHVAAIPYNQSMRNKT